MLRRIAEKAVVFSLLLAASLSAAQTVTLTPSSVSFGNEPVDTTSGSQTLTLSNGTSTNMTDLNGKISADFGYTNNCGSTLNAGRSCQIFVTFTPNATGSFNGTMQVTYKGPSGSPLTTSLSGSGVSDITLSPASLVFGNQADNSTSVPQTVTVTNIGSASVTVSSVTVPSGFGQTNTCTSALSQNGSCTVNVSFSPTSVSTYSGSLTVNDNADSGSSQTAGVTGTGINPAISKAFFAMDINQNNVVNSPNNPHDYWPGTSGTGASGVSFGTYLTLGSSIKWNDLYDCTTGQYVFQGAGASSNKLLAWGNEANPKQSIMFTAYYTPDCLVPASVQSTTGTTWCAFKGQQTISGDHEYYGCDLPGDVLTNEGNGVDYTYKTFLTDLLTYLTNTTYFQTQWPTIYIEVWNEPNDINECNPTTSSQPGNCTAAALAQMVADAKSIAGGFTNVKIISPAVTGTQPGDCTLTGTNETINSYLATLLGESPSVLSNADYIGFHGYSVIPTLAGTYDPAAGASCEADLIASVQSVIAGDTSASIPIYDTEGSWGTGGNAAIQGSSNPPYQNQAEEAAFTGAYYLIQASNSSCASTTSPCDGMGGFSWYGWDFDNQGTDPGSTGQFWDQWASPSGALTQAGETYEILYSWLNGASPVAPCFLQPGNTNTVIGVWTCQFEGSGSSAGLAVWDSSQSCKGVMSQCPYSHSNWTIPSSLGTYSEWRDLYTGTVTQLNGATTVNIGLVPILLDNGTVPGARLPKPGAKDAAPHGAVKGKVH